MTPSPEKRAWRPFALVLAAVVAHGLCLGTPFFLDDQYYLLTSWQVRENPFAGGVWKFRIVPHLFWHGLYLVFGSSAPAFHALNLLVHAATSVAVYGAARAVFALDREGRCLAPSRRDGVAFWGALVFAVHPLASEVPHYAAQTSIAFATLFSTLVVRFTAHWLLRPRWSSLLAVLLAFALASFSKEPGLFHAGMNAALVVGAYAPLRAWGAWLRRHWKTVLPALLLLVAAAAVLAFAFDWIAKAAATFGSDQFLGHMLTQARVFWQYTWRAFLPLQLCADHFMALTVSPGDAIAWLAFGGLVLLLAAVRILHARGLRLVTLLASLTLAPLLIRFFYLAPEPFVEYRAYPALCWFGPLVACGVARAFAKTPSRAVLAMSLLTFVLVILSVRRGFDWQSPTAIGANILRQYPLHLRSHSYLQAHELEMNAPADVLKRQRLLGNKLTLILELNRDPARKHRQYDHQQAYLAYMAGEQMAAYALIQLDRSAEAVARLDHVIKEMRRLAGGFDQSHPFAVLYRVRGKAKAALGNTDGAHADYHRALDRIPRDFETLRLLSELEAGERPANEGAG